MIAADSLSATNHLPASLSRHLLFQPTQNPTQGVSMSEPNSNPSPKPPAPVDAREMTREQYQAARIEIRRGNFPKPTPPTKGATS